ncbi:MAG: hypothetical protein IPO62_14655 [Saprospiraceae bacterium]|nr:hypothetical protein [Saprospiraceae bacterium]
MVKINSNKVWKSLFNNSKSYSAGAITNHGELYLWGDNQEGQLGNGEYTSKQTILQLLPQYKWKSFCTSYQHGLYLTEDGYLFTSGKNLNGELGDGYDCF